MKVIYSGFLQVTCIYTTLVAETLFCFVETESQNKMYTHGEVKRPETNPTEKN